MQEYSKIDSVVDRKIVLIFGGTGSLGRALIRRWANKAEIHVCSRDEAKHWTLRNEIGESHHALFHVGDTRDATRVKRLVTEIRPHIVISAAAIKHVDTCELSPEESIATNVNGVSNIVDAVRNNGDVSCLLHVSTDKACEPVNVYGMCKALAERLVTSQTRGRKGQERGPKYVCVRYGNVLESRGSIIPLFKWQAEHRDALTVTDPDMTRFVMTLDESVDLIEAALKNAEHGETWVPRLPSMRIGDLAQLFAECFDKRIERVDIRPGEKQHEDLIGRTEAMRTYGTRKFWIDCNSQEITNYVILPSTKQLSRFIVQHKQLIAKRYTSNDEVMSKEALRTHLEMLGILKRPLSEFTGTNIEEIRTT